MMSLRQRKRIKKKSKKFRSKCRKLPKPKLKTRLHKMMRKWQKSLLRLLLLPRRLLFLIMIDQIYTEWRGNNKKTQA